MVHIVHTMEINCGKVGSYAKTGIVDWNYFFPEGRNNMVRTHTQQYYCFYSLGRVTKKASMS